MEDDFKDEGSDSRVLGKRSRSEASDKNRTGRTDKKALLKSKQAGERKTSKSLTPNKSTPNKRSSRPGSKEARLKRLGQYVDSKPDTKKSGFGKPGNK